MHSGPIDRSLHNMAAYIGTLSYYVLISFQHLFDLFCLVIDQYI